MLCVHYLLCSYEYDTCYVSCVCVMCPVSCVLSVLADLKHPQLLQTFGLYLHAEGQILDEGHMFISGGFQTEDFLPEAQRGKERGITL